MYLACINYTNFRLSAMFAIVADRLIFINIVNFHRELTLNRADYILNCSFGHVTLVGYI